MFRSCCSPAVLALANCDMPMVAIAPNDALIGKLNSKVEEVRTRCGELQVIT